MFAAAMLFSTPALELSIYSTCKRISQKLMRNVAKFLDIIYKSLPNSPTMPVIRSNMEEIVLQGADGVHDIRIVNSYPSKVSLSQSLNHVTVLQSHVFAQVLDVIALVEILNHEHLSVLVQRIECISAPTDIFAPIESCCNVLHHALECVWRHGLIRVQLPVDPLSLVLHLLSMLTVTLTLLV